MARLRWIAVFGQIGATVLGVAWLHLQLPLGWIALLIGVTATSNLLIQIWDRLQNPPPWIAPAVIVLDVAVFTVLIGLTGGTDNPFCALYAVHVAMAVVVLGGGWAWIVMLLTAACYAMISFLRRPLLPQPSSTIFELGRWASLLLVTGLIAYFVNRVMRSLQLREEELAAARERGRRGEHLASLTTLAAGAAHELGTPLSTIALVAHEMERGVDPQSFQEDAALIRKEVERCRQILDRMRVDVIDDARQLAASETLDQLVSALRQDLRADEVERLRVEFICASTEVIPYTRVLRRAIGVLLRNAFDASTSDGIVKLAINRARGLLAFQVRDTGSGMTETVRRRAGEPFFTTKDPGAGMGLGLFLVRLVAETYGGKFDLQSAQGSGTCSTLELPDRPMHAAAYAGSEMDASDRGRRRDFPEPAGQSAR